MLNKHTSKQIYQLMQQRKLMLANGNLICYFWPATLYP